MPDASHIHALLMAYAAYVLGASSPGPSNMAIMNTAMSRGRSAAFAVAAGVVTISWTWAVLASTGLSAVLMAYPGTLAAIRLVGGVYLVYLGIRAARSALHGKNISVTVHVPLSRSEFRTLYRQGILIHVVNPKSIMAWIATISLGLRSGAPAYMPFIIMLGCAVLSVAIFGGYAIVFSFPAMSRLYTRAQRWIDGALAIFFIGAGLSMLAQPAGDIAIYLFPGFRGDA